MTLLKTPIIDYNNSCTQQAREGSYNQELWMIFIEVVHGVVHIYLIHTPWRAHNLHQWKKDVIDTSKETNKTWRNVPIV